MQPKDLAQVYLLALFVWLLLIGIVTFYSPKQQNATSTLEQELTENGFKQTEEEKEDLPQNVEMSHFPEPGAAESYLRLTEGEEGNLAKMEIEHKTSNILEVLKRRRYSSFT